MGRWRGDGGRPAVGHKGARRGASRVKHIIAVALTELAATFDTLLAENGVCVTLVRDIGNLDLLLARTEHVAAPALVLVRVRDAAQIDQIANVLGGRGLIWAGCAQDGADAVLTAAGYRAGAAAMVPLDAPAAVLAALARRLLASAPGKRFGASASAQVQRVFRAGETLRLAPGHVCVIGRGVVALHGVDPGGRPMVLGFAGVGEAIIPGLPDDQGLAGIVYVAHTAVVAVAMPWESAIEQAQFHDAQSARIASMEAWACAQADPQVERRILHTLRVLARLVGTPHPRGTFIAARITHSQLAAAVGVTRSTVTRLIGTLRQHGMLLLVRGRDDEVRYCLPGPASASQDRRA